MPGLFYLYEEDECLKRLFFLPVFGIYNGLFKGSGELSF